MSDEGTAPQPSLALATYLRLRGIKAPAKRHRRGIHSADENQPFTAGRDPQGLGDIVAVVTREAGWDGALARADVVRLWDEVAGAETAAHAQPEAFEGGVLTVRCDSTAWAKHLSMIRGAFVSQLVAAHPDAGIEQVRFMGPDAPSWKRGLRTVPGRGPRDTYG